MSFLKYAVLGALALAAAERPDLTILRGRCPAIGRAVTYWPLAEIVRATAGIALDDSAAVAAGKLQRTVSELLGRAGAAPEDALATLHALIRPRCYAPNDTGYWNVKICAT